MGDVGKIIVSLVERSREVLGLMQGRGGKIGDLRGVEKVECGGGRFAVGFHGDFATRNQQ